MHRLKVSYRSPESYTRYLDVKATVYYKKYMHDGLLSLGSMAVCVLPGLGTLDIQRHIASGVTHLGA